MGKEDLWGELPDIGELRPPISLLKEQGKRLGEKTRGLLVGEVFTDECDTGFMARFYVVAPTLGGYRHQLLRVSYGLDFYPVKVQQSGRESWTTCMAEADFRNTVQEILTDEHVREVLRRLLAHIRAEGAE